MVVIPAGSGRAIRLRAGQSARVVNTHGHQVVDTWAFCDPDVAEFMSMSHTRVSLGSLFVAVGQSAVTNHRRPIVTLVEDSSPGVHDTLMAACDRYRYELLGALEHANCADNLAGALNSLGLSSMHTPDPWNLFMHVRQADQGMLVYEPPVSRPGDHVVLRAELDCVVVFSACPQDLVPVNAGEPVDVAFSIIEG